MEFTEVKVSTTTAGLDTLTNLLDDIGVEGYVLEDAKDFAEFLEDTQIYWDYIDENLLRTKQSEESTITFYLTMDEAGQAVLHQLDTALARLRMLPEASTWGKLTYTVGTVRQEDWEWGWKQYFKPFPVGRRFYIKPSWEELEDTQGRMVLEIDPASSFGTGSHETTQLCITALEQYVKEGDSVLDMGTGSGILAIASAMLGAQVQMVVDIDPHCLATAQENAQKNGVSIGQSLCGDVLQDASLASQLATGVDCIVANIVADIIMGMTPLFANLLKQGGTLICSGILSERADEVQNMLQQQGFILQERTQKGDWVCFVAKNGHKA